MTPIHIGLDLDNTLVCYDGLFACLSREHSSPPSTVGGTKREVRDAMREAGQEDLWTEFQGLAYGPRMSEARPFPGVTEFVSSAVARGDRLSIVSHKTRYPYRGPRYDLQASARQWLATHLGPAGIPDARVYLEETRDAKLARICSEAFDLFIDDLPEFLDDTNFPDHVDRLLFDPHGEYRGSGLHACRTWSEIDSLVARRSLPSIVDRSNRG